MGLKPTFKSQVKKVGSRFVDQSVCCPFKPTTAYVTGNGLAYIPNKKALKVKLRNANR